MSLGVLECLVKALALKVLLLHHLQHLHRGLPPHCCMRLRQLSFYLAGVTLTLLLSACTGDSSSRLNSLSVGMTKSQVVHILGDPDSTAAIGNAGPWGTTENLRYQLLSPRGFWGTYYVKLRGDRVVSYGLMGDYPAAKP